MEVWYRLGRGLFLALSRWQEPQWFPPQRIDSPQGLLNQTALTFLDDNGARYVLTFALPVQYPLLLWKISVRNDTQKVVYLQRLVMLDAKRYHPKGKPGFFSNGWQSWSYTGAYGLEDRFQRTRLGPLFSPVRVNHGTPQPGASGHFASDMFGILGDRLQRTAFLAGFLSQKQNFGSLEAHLAKESSSLRMWANADSIHLEPGRDFISDWACLQYLELDDPDPLGPYLEAVAREHMPDYPATSGPIAQDASSWIPTGWSSWHAYSQKVKPEDIRRNLQAASELRPDLPIQLIQLDDGFESQVGDWFHFNDKFKGGVAPLADDIRSAGFLPGLWLAPFIVNPRSRLAAVHPEWLLHGRANRPVSAGFIWNGFANALDLTHPEALQYASEVVQTATRHWGFNFLKLDFLYAGALSGRHHDPTRTRAQVLRSALEALRQAAGPQVFLLGCGCPLGSAIGLVQGMRIGASVARRWNPAHFGTEFFFKAEPDLHSARNAIQNSITRAPLHRRWWVNDPDCLLLDPDMQLTPAEVHSLATVIAITGGSLLLSDELPGLPPERVRIARQLLPVIGQRPRVLDWFDAATPSRLRLDLQSAADAWHILALFNWQDQAQETSLNPVDFGLPLDTYTAREFWSGKLARIEGKGLPWEIPAHGVGLFAMRKAEALGYLGSDLHVSQGLEVKSWTVSEDQSSLTIIIERPGRESGEIFLSLPETPRQVTLDGKFSEWQSVYEGFYRLSVAFSQSARLEVHW